MALLQPLVFYDFVYYAHLTSVIFVYFECQNHLLSTIWFTGTSIQHRFIVCHDFLYYAHLFYVLFDIYYIYIYIYVIYIYILIN